jgi:hypothetical protein
MGEYKLIIRFDTPKPLPEEDRRLIKMLVTETLGLLEETQRIEGNGPMPKATVIYSKLLNVTDSGKDP